MGSPWCATSIDEDKHMKSWDECGPGCPGFSRITTPQLDFNFDNAPGSCYCGIPNPFDWYAPPRVVGGHNSFVGMHPWQVALLYYGSSLDKQECGGTLVGDRYVVTAAHCTDFLSSPSQIYVRIGDTSLDTEFEATAFTHEVSKIIQHPNYDSSAISNDMAILKLAQKVDLFSYPNIKPACLPRGESFQGIGVVSGWGTVGSGLHTVSWLQSVDVKIFSNGDCGSMNDYMTSDMLCAGYMDGGIDACQGDSGGPLVVHDKVNNEAYTLAGVVSWGFGCADKDALGIYANVSHFIPWLRRKMP